MSFFFLPRAVLVSIRKEFAGGIFGGDADYGRFEYKVFNFSKLSMLWSKCYPCPEELEPLESLMVTTQMYHFLKSFSWAALTI